MKGRKGVGGWGEGGCESGPRVHGGMGVEQGELKLENTLDPQHGHAQDRPGPSHPPPMNF